MVRIVAVLVISLAGSACEFDGAYDLPLPGKQVGEDDGYDVTADFADILNVVPRSPVMVDDVPVGQVLDVERVGWRARVHMRIRDDIKLPDDAVAEIRQTSLLGEKYISVAAPGDDSVATDLPATPVSSGGRLGEGDHIPIARTSRNPEVEEVLGALSFLLSAGGVGQLKTISQELNKMMTGRTGEIRSMFRRLDTLVATLEGQKGDIINALDSVNDLSRTLIAEKETIGSAIDALGPALKVLSAQHKNLIAMLAELDRLGSVGTRVINATKEDLIAQLRHLEQPLRKLADTDERLVPGLVAAASYPFPLEAIDVIKGDYANVVFKMQIKLTPVSEGGLIPTNLQELDAVCKSTPLVPICVQTGPGIEQLCSVLGSLPLCAQTPPGAARGPGGDLGGTAASPAPPLSPGSPGPSQSVPTPDGSGTTAPSGDPLAQLFGGWLGGAA